MKRTLILLFIYKLYKVTATKRVLLLLPVKVFILTHRLGGVAVFWLIPGGSVGLIPAAAVFPFIIHATEMEGGQEESMVTSHLPRGDLFQVVWRSWRNTRDVVARIQGEPTVPGKIPGGVASRAIPGRVVRTLGGELVFPGMIPSGVVSRPIPGRVVRTLAGNWCFLVWFQVV